MMYTNKHAEEFWNGATKAVGINADVDLSKKVLDEADKRECVRRAFRDLTVRTMKKQPSKDEIKLDELAKACCDEKAGLLLWLDELFRKPYPEMDPQVDLDTDAQRGHQKDFDAWHKEACDRVIVFLKKTYLPAHCTYGKAQKIVNMTLKSLYALCVVKGIDKTYAKYFRYCHVPLDTYTLEWFYRECLKNKTKVVKGHIANWSAISEYGNEHTDTYVVVTEKGEKNYFYTYFYFQKLFRRLPNTSTPTPLQAEFVIWPLIQKEIVAEEFLFVLMNPTPTQRDKNKIRLWSYADKITEIKKLI